MAKFFVKKNIAKAKTISTAVYTSTDAMKLSKKKYLHLPGSLLLIRTGSMKKEVVIL
jgi:hypothetical protein